MNSKKYSEQQKKYSTDLISLADQFIYSLFIQPNLRINAEIQVRKIGAISLLLWLFLRSFCVTVQYTISTHILWRTINWVSMLAFHAKSTVPLLSLFKKGNCPILMILLPFLHSSFCFYGVLHTAAAIIFAVSISVESVLDSVHHYFVISAPFLSSWHKNLHKS